jgi:hypothetical protein
MLDLPYQLGTPTRRSAVTLWPLFPLRDPVCDYGSLDEALAAGLEIGEVDMAGDVGELLVRNPLDRGVLLYDGEELVGAKQNRILNVSVLLAPLSRTRIPVSCVERGRWSWRGHQFRSAGHIAGPALRQRKAVSLRPDPLARGVAQHTVWATVDEQLTAAGVASPTSAQSDGVAARSADIEALAAGFALEPGQCGLIAAVAGRGWCLDAVSRPAVFARLWDKLLAGHLYDALGAAGATVPGERALEALRTCKVRQSPSAALGEDLRIDGADLIGSGLVVDGELVQLSAYGGGSWA